MSAIIDPSTIFPKPFTNIEEFLDMMDDKEVGQFTDKINYREVATWRDGTEMTDEKCDGVVFLKKEDKFYKREFFGSINVKDFGAKGDGITDDSLSIQKAFYVANLIFYGGNITTDTGYTGWFEPEVIFPTGKYLTSKVNIYSRIKVKGIGQVVIQNINGSKDLFNGYFVDNAVTNIYFENLTFLYFDTVFRIPTGNVDFSFIHFKSINIAKCNLFVDTVSYAMSRSTSIVFERCRANYGLKQFCKIYCDKAEFDSNWFTNDSDQIYMEIDSFANFRNNVWVPTGAHQTKAWIKFTGSDKARGLVFISERFGGENGQCPIVVVGDVNKDNSNIVLRSQGITFVGCTMSSYNLYNPLNIDNGGVRSAIILEQLSAPNRDINFIKFINCNVGPNDTTKIVSSYNVVNNYYQSDFVIDLDYSTAALFKKYSNSKIVSDDLLRYLNIPVTHSNISGIPRNGIINSVATATSGVRKVSFKVNRKCKINGYHSPIQFLAILLGQSDTANANAAWAYSSTYMISISGGLEGTSRSKIKYTKLAGDTGGVSLLANADIVSAHWGLNDAGSSDKYVGAVLDNVFDDITITFGKQMPIGYAVIIPFFDFSLI